jgi:hypothetical protein
MPTDNTGVPGFNRAQTVLASNAYTSNQAVSLKNHANRGIHVILDVTAKTGTPTNIILSIKGIDPASGKKYLILAGAAVTAVSTNVYRVFPAATAAANSVANDFVPMDFEISVVGTGVDANNNFTYSVGINYF